MNDSLNKGELLDMIRLRADKYVTRSKMYINDGNNEYMIWENPTTNEQEILTLKRELLNVKRAVMNSRDKSNINELLIRVIFYHEIVLKSATKSVKDPGHETSIDILLDKIRKVHKDKLNRKSELPERKYLSQALKDMSILKKNYHPDNFVIFTRDAKNPRNTYLNENLLIRKEDISYEELKVPEINGNDNYDINGAIFLLDKIIWVYKSLLKSLNDYEHNNIMFNNYTYDKVQGMRNRGEGNKEE